MKNNRLGKGHFAKILLGIFVSTLLSTSCLAVTQGAALRKTINTNVNGATYENYIATSQGGAVYFSGSANTFSVTDSILNKNFAPYGGAIYKESGNLTINSSSFERNSVSQRGGAIFNANNQFLIKNSTFNDNYASNSSSVGSSISTLGGAIYTAFSSSISGSNSGTYSYKNEIGLIGLSNTFKNNYSSSAVSSILSGVNTSIISYGGAIYNSVAGTGSSSGIANLTLHTNINYNNFHLNFTTSKDSSSSQGASSYAYSYGGAIYNAASSSASGTGTNAISNNINITNNIFLENSVLSENTSNILATTAAKTKDSNAAGGAIFNNSTASTSSTGKNSATTITNITNNTLNLNSVSTSNIGTATRTSSTYSANTNANAYGGAIYNSSSATSATTVTESSTKSINTTNISNNDSINVNSVTSINGASTDGTSNAYGQGGAIYNTISSTNSGAGSTNNSINITDNTSINSNGVTVNNFGITTGTSNAYGYGGAIRLNSAASNTGSGSADVASKITGNLDISSNALSVNNTGTITGTSNAYGYGGAIYNSASSISNAVIGQNTAYAANSTEISNNTSIKNNTINVTNSSATIGTSNSYGYGGAISNYVTSNAAGTGLNKAISSTKINSNIITNNTLTIENGDNSVTSDITTNGNSVTNACGGGISNVTYASTSNSGVNEAQTITEINDNIISYNTAIGKNIGAIAATTAARTNSANVAGGGVLNTASVSASNTAGINSASTVLTISDNILTNNTVYAINSSSRSADSTYAVNTYAYGYGGAVYNTVTATNATTQNVSAYSYITGNSLINNNSLIVYNDSTTSLGATYAYGYGGAIYNKTTATNSSTGNLNTETYIEGLANNYTAFSNNLLTVTNTGNTSGGSNYAGAYGGVIYNQASLLNSSTGFAENSTFIRYNNFQQNKINIENSRTMTLGTSNVNGSGGVIFNSLGLITASANSASNSAIISSNIFKDNSINITNSGTVSVGNYAYGYGGAIYNEIIAANTGAYTNSSANLAIISNNLFESNKLNILNSGIKTNVVNASALGGAVYATITSSNSSTGQNSSSNITNITGNSFIDNIASVTNESTSTSASLSSQGGAIYATITSNNTSTGVNSSNNIININDNNLFSGNKAIYGGAITARISSSNSNTGINSSNNTINIKNNTFKNNEATVGGAIYTFSTIATDSIIAASSNNNTINIAGNIFEANTARYGGAITNQSYTSSGVVFSEINLTDNIFKNNIASYSGTSAIAYGGAIYNYGRSSTGNAIATIEMNGGSFIGNSASAIYSDASSSSATSKGGAIYNSAYSTTGKAISKVDISNTSFSNNSVTANSETSARNSSSTAIAYGGAVANEYSKSGTSFTDAILNIKNASFINNIVSASASAIGSYTTSCTTRATALGGAIYNNGTANISNSLFSDNTATATSTGVNSSSYAQGYGGAIYNAGKMTLENSVFNNNNASTAGGAIYNNGVLNIIADNGVTSFTGNKASGVSNAIYLNSGSTLNLNAGNNGAIVFNDKIASASNSNIININKSGIIGTDGVTAAPTNGTIAFNDTVSNSMVNLHGGTLSLSKENLLNSSNLTLGGGTLSLLNNSIGTMNVNSLALTNSTTTNLSIDADLANNYADKITSNTPVSGTGSLNVNHINLLSTSTANKINLSIADDNVKNYVTMTPTSVETDIFKYDLAYNKDSGLLSFSSAGSSGGYTGFNPKVLTSTVNTQTGSYLTQANIYGEALGRMDAITSMSKLDRLVLKYQNRVAAADGSFVFSPTFLAENSKGLWFKQFATFENVPLQNGPNVSNVSYGMLIGGDTDIKSLGHGFDGYLTFYGGYNGSHQNYANTGVYQNGGLLGATGTVYRGNFFGSLTVNAGANNGNTSANDNFTTVVGGVATKAGYNFELFDGKLIFQPSLMLAYTFANTFDYTTTSGVNISSTALNVFQFVPGIKFIGNLKNGWQPYVAVNMVSNITMGGNFYANDVQLPDMSVAPYVEYGVGIQRKFGDRLSGFAQTMLRGGGRNGLALQWGLRWAF